MRADMHLEIQVPGSAFAGGRLALASETDQLTVDDSRGDRDPHLMRCELDVPFRRDLRPLELERAGRAAIGILEIEVDAGVMFTAASPAAALVERLAAAKER
jgi:hypothetical protein